ncbi:MAG TPA: hypothetical protein VHG08_12285 [Longimicrobium sp.]|nr:hypothetical protein [Longimicrobium sp.]
MKSIGWRWVAAAILAMAGIAAACDAPDARAQAQPMVDVPFDTAMGGLVVVRAAINGGEAGGGWWTAARPSASWMRRWRSGAGWSGRGAAP